MTRVELISDELTYAVADRVEKFLNSIHGIQILDISWFMVGRITVCAITYFEVDA